MNRDAQYLRHWAAMARLTEEQSSSLSADTLEALAGKFEALEADNVALKDCVSKYAEAVKFWNSWADEEDRLEPIPQTPPAPVVKVIELPPAGRIEGYGYMFDMNDVFEALEAAGQPFKHGDGAVIQPKVSTPPAPVVRVPDCFVSLHEEIKNRHNGRMPKEVQDAFDACTELLRLNDNSAPATDSITPPPPEMPFTYAELKDMQGAEFARGYECGWKRRGESEDTRRNHKTTAATDNTAAQYESLSREKKS